MKLKPIENKYTGNTQIDNPAMMRSIVKVSALKASVNTQNQAELLVLA